MPSRALRLRTSSRAAIAALGAALAAAAAHALEVNQPRGAASFKFLKLPLSARTAALGGAGVAEGGGANEIDLTPAAAAGDSGAIWAGKGFPYAEFKSGAEHITWNVPVAGDRLLLNARYLGFDDLRGFDADGQPTTAYSAYGFKVQAGWAGDWHGLAWGATANFAQDNIAFANYYSLLLDLGLRYQILPGLWAGAAATNGDLWDSKALEPGDPKPFAPASAQAGLAYRHALPAGFGAAVEVDARARNDEDMAVPAGLEVDWRQLLILRLGFPFREQEPGPSAGLAVHWGRFSFEYAFQSHATLSPAQYWALGIRY